LDPQARDILDLLAREGPRLHALLVRLTLRQDVAEELMQDLFLKLYHARGYAEATNRGGYAWQAAVHLAFDWRRSRNRRRDAEPLPAEPAVEPSSPLEGLVAAEEAEQILTAARELPETMRYVFVMHWIQEQPYETIAADLGKTVHQVRGLSHKAMSRVRLAVEAPRLCPGREDCHAER
jgi:RNA polymerase sigma-70 factor, ECF subfamily